MGQKLSWSKFSLIASSKRVSPSGHGLEHFNVSRESNREGTLENPTPSTGTTPSLIQEMSPTSHITPTSSIAATTTATTATTPTTTTTTTRIANENIKRELTISTSPQNFGSFTTLCSPHIVQSSCTSVSECSTSLASSTPQNEESNVYEELSDDKEHVIQSQCNLSIVPLLSMKPSATIVMTSSGERIMILDRILLGSGTFCKVMLCMSLKTKQLYAMKIYSRSQKKKRSMRGSPIKRMSLQPFSSPLSSSSSRVIPNLEEQSPKYKSPGASLLKESRARSSSENSTLCAIDPMDESILTEIQILKRVGHHPNIIKLYEVIDAPDQDKVFMLFEYMEGGCVMKIHPSNKSDRDPYTEKEAKRIMKSLFHALDYLHENNIAHRDIKPDNLMIDSMGNVKMIDFGVSCIFPEGDDIIFSSSGTPAFQAPECCQPVRFSGKAADIWSAGVTLYVMLFGMIPFHGNNIIEMYQAIRNDVPRFDCASPLLVDFLGRLLEKDPKKRMTISECKNHDWLNSS